MSHRFGGFEPEEGRFELRRESVPVRLEPRALELLHRLARHPGQVVDLSNNLVDRRIACPAGVRAPDAVARQPEDAP